MVLNLENASEYADWLENEYRPQQEIRQPTIKYE